MQIKINMQVNFVGIKNNCGDKKLFYDYKCNKKACNVVVLTCNMKDELREWIMLQSYMN